MKRSMFYLIIVLAAVLAAGAGWATTITVTAPATSAEVTTSSPQAPTIISPGWTCGRDLRQKPMENLTALDVQRSIFENADKALTQAIVLLDLIEAAKKKALESVSASAPVVKKDESHDRITKSRESAERYISQVISRLLQGTKYGPYERNLMEATAALTEDILKRAEEGAERFLGVSFGAEGSQWQWFREKVTASSIAYYAADCFTKTDVEKMMAIQLEAVKKVQEAVEKYKMTRETLLKKAGGSQ